MQTLRLFRGKTLRGAKRTNFVIENFGNINNIDDWYIPYFPNDAERFKGIATCDNRSITIEDTKDRIIYMLSFSMIRVLLLGKNCDVPCTGYTIVKMHAAKRREIVLDALLRVERLEIDEAIMQEVVPREMSLATLQTSSKLALDCAGKDSSDKYFNYIREYKKRLTTLSTKSSRDRIYAIWVKMFSEAMYGRETVLKLLSIEQAIDELCPVMLPPSAINSLIEIDADANMEVLTKTIKTPKIIKNDNSVKNKSNKKLTVTSKEKRTTKSTKTIGKQEVNTTNEAEAVKISEEAPKKRKGRRKSKKVEVKTTEEVVSKKRITGNASGKKVKADIDKETEIETKSKERADTDAGDTNETVNEFPELDMYSDDLEISDPFSSYMESLGPEENDMLGDDEDF